jgi:DNA phosphorothioation-dependent restriction protein DptH
MNLPENATPYLAQTLTRLLGKSMPGSMAFIRCLPAEVVRALAADKRFVVADWKIAAVTSSTDDRFGEAHRLHTARQHRCLLRR